MKFRHVKLTVALGLVLFAIGMAAIACMDRTPAWTCPIPQAAIKEQVRGGGFDKVDILVVVDNSGSMEEEQARLASGFRSLVEALMNPPAEWKVAQVNNIRIAVVSTDMGVGTQNTMTGCQNKLPGGDAGRFQHPGNTLTGCAATYPVWIETTPTTPNAQLADDFACIATLGTEGCGFEQQLYAAAYALSREDQQEFMRDNALLAILVISDESDCSAEPGNAVWSNPDLTATNRRLNLFCAEHESELIPTDALAALLKKKGNDQNVITEGSVVFAAIVGVPMVNACQGQGDALGDCMGLAEMKFKECVDPGTSNPTLCTACVSTNINPETGEPETAAAPGRRFVRVAQAFGENGYVYSICNNEWGPAMQAIAKRIAENLAGVMFGIELEWDSSKKMSKCDVIFERTNTAACPSGLRDMGVIEDKETGHQYRACEVNAIAHAQSCEADINLDQSGKVGWIYCECTSGVCTENPKLGKYNVLITTAAKDRTKTGGTLWVECLTKADMPAGLCPPDQQ